MSLEPNDLQAWMEKDRYLALRAGQLSLLFDRVTGGLRNIAYNDHCVWLGLAMLVRDANWQTVSTRLVKLESKQDDKQFHIAFTAESLSPSIHFAWQAIVRGDEGSRIEYRFLGEAKTAFAANRIGFCLLHPADLCSGQPLRQYRIDGSIVDGSFPSLIEPQIVGQYSIRDLSKLEHQFGPSQWAMAEFEGDVFETEDQRNWSDASFKTYCTPLERPFPVSYAIGDRCEQTVRLSIPPSNDKTAAKTKAEPHVPDTALPRPKFGLVLTSHGTEFPIDQRESLRQVCQQLAVDHLRYDLVLPPAVDQQLDALERFSSTIELVRFADSRLELALHLPALEDSRWEPLVDRLTDFADAICRILVFRTGFSTTQINDVRKLRRSTPKLNIPIGGGSDAHFCELNRDQTLGLLPIQELEFVSWSLCPTVHADDSLTLMENVRSLPAMLETAKQFSLNKPLIITPISLRPRFNSVATSKNSNPHQGHLSDARQTQTIAAVWTHQVLKHLTDFGASSITWFEVFGPRGIARWPTTGTSASIDLYPVGEGWSSKKVDLLRTTTGRTAHD
jgi:D-apionolactonase